MTLSYACQSAGHGVYAFVLDGQASIDGASLGRRDSTGIWGKANLAITTDPQGCDLLIIESAP